MRKSRETDIDKILKVTDEEVFELKKDFCWLIDNFQKEEDEDFEKAKQEVEEIFSKYIKDFDQISIATLQRKFHIGYTKAAKFIDILAIKNIVTKEFGVRDILNKQQFLQEAVRYFTPLIRDKNKLNELNKNDIFAFILHDEFEPGKVDYYWLERLIGEHFVYDEKYIKTIDEIFGTRLSKVKNHKEKTKNIFNDSRIVFRLLVVVTLQYFTEKLKYKTLSNWNYNNTDLKEKIKNLRF